VIRPRRQWIVEAVLLVLLASACSQAPRVAPETAEQRRAYQAALAALEESPQAGEAALRRYLELHPHSPRAPDARLRLAEIALRDGREQQAFEQLQELLSRAPDSEVSDRARLELARLQSQRGDAEGAWATARRIRIARLESDRRREAYALLADLAEGAGEPLAQLLWLAQLRGSEESPERAAEVDARIDRVLRGLPDAALEELAQQLERRPPVASVRLEQVERALGRGDPVAAGRFLEQASELPLAARQASRLGELRRRLGEGRIAGQEALDALPTYAALAHHPPPDLSGAAADLGVVLPLSGPYAAFGEAALEGVVLASGLFDPAPELPSRVRLRVRDSAGDPLQADRVVRELAADPRVLAVVGPLLTAECEVAGGAAEAAGLPLLTLTRREGVALGRRFVLRLGGAPRLEALALAEYATGALGLHRFAILYPDDPYGRALRSAFWDAVEARGGQVVGVARYPSRATDFAGPIRRLIGFDLLTPEMREALAEREKLRKRAKRLPPEQAAALRQEAAATTGPEGEPLPPFVDFDALFIPDAGERAALIASHLAFHGVRGVRLLGPSDWNQPELVQIGGHFLDGAVFASRYFEGSRYPFVADFTRRFRTTFGHAPGFLEAQSYDASALVLSQVLRGARSRGEVLDGLLSTRVWAGASGILRVGPDGGVIRRPQLLGVEYGRVLSVDERGAPPFLPEPEPEELPERPPTAAQVPP